MSWASHPTTEMPSAQISTGGRHRGRRRHLVVALVTAGLVAVALLGAIFAPGLLDSPPRVSSAPATAGPDSAPAGSAGSVPIAVATDAPAPSDGASGSGTPTDAAVSVTDSAGLEAAVFALTNAERAGRGCSPVVLDARLAAAARSHSVEMARTGAFGHAGANGSGPGDRMRLAGYDTRSGWAENIAHGQASPAAVMAAWMGSEGHRGNILNCTLRAVGVGAARGDNVQVYWTQDFGG